MESAYTGEGRADRAVNNIRLSEARSCLYLLSMLNDGQWQWSSPPHTLSFISHTMIMVIVCFHASIIKIQTLMQIFHCVPSGRSRAFSVFIVLRWNIVPGATFLYISLHLNKNQKKKGKTRQIDFLSFFRFHFLDTAFCSPRFYKNRYLAPKTMFPCDSTTKQQQY